MRLVSRFGGVFLACLLATLSAHTSELRLGLVISAGDYPEKVGALTNTYADGDLIAETLETLTFKVTRSVDQNQEELRKTVIGLADQITAAKQADPALNVSVVVYASMHGAVANDGERLQNYWLPAHEQINSPASLITYGYKIEGLIGMLKSAGADALIVVSDACRNELKPAFSKSSTKGFVRVNQRNNVILAFATPLGETTPDDGLFARVFAEKLMAPNLKPNYAILETIEDVGRSRPLGGRPYWTSGGLPDWFCLNGCPIDTTEELGFLERRVEFLEDQLGDLGAGRQQFTQINPFLLGLNRNQLNEMISDDGFRDVLLSRKDILSRYEIDTPRRLAHFVTQVSIESDDLQRLDVSLNFSGDMLWRLFPSAFASQAEARSFSGQSRRIANRILANKLGNGDEESGDGWRYRGRGIVPLLGKANYVDVGTAIGVDLAQSPELASQPQIALEIFAAYWRSNQLNELADQDDLAAITLKVHDSNDDLDSRESVLIKWLDLFDAEL